MSGDLLSGVAITEPRHGLRERLTVASQAKRPLIVKLGFDPTAPDLHLGHAVVLQKLKDFQDEGHKIVVIIGDFTASIGDPTGRNKMRPPLSVEQIDLNAKTYVEQLSKVIDIRKIEIRRNSEWFNKMNLSETIKLVSGVTVAQIMQREDFKKRFDGNIPIALHELMYPIMQGYDSVVIQADVEIGGTDQLFNCLMGRALQEARGLPAQTVITMPLLVGLDGVEKMSKSKHNYIGLTESPENMFGKAMSIPDKSIPSYIELGTTFSQEMKAELLDQLNSDTNPMAIKKLVAFDIVKRFNGEEAALEAQQNFERKVQRREHNAEDFTPISLEGVCEKISPPITILDACSFVAPDMTKGEIRRLASGGGIKISGQKAIDPLQELALQAGLTLQIGKRRMFRFE